MRCLCSHQNGAARNFKVKILDDNVVEITEPVTASWLNYCYEIDWEAPGAVESMRFQKQYAHGSDEDRSYYERELLKNFGSNYDVAMSDKELVCKVATERKLQPDITAASLVRYPGDVTIFGVLVEAQGKRESATAQFSEALNATPNHCAAVPPGPQMHVFTPGRPVNPPPNQPMANGVAAGGFYHHPPFYNNAQQAPHQQAQAVAQAQAVQHEAQNAPTGGGKFFISFSFSL